MFNHIFILRNFVDNYTNKIFKLDGFVYLRNLMIFLIVDSLLLDDEPLWEPLEWSVIQTWIIYIYIFSWSAETIFSSRYGSYTNRDKIVWSGLFKVYYYIKIWFVLNIIFITIFVTMPFYSEITYSISYIVVWWNWFTSYSFFKTTFIFSFCYTASLLTKLSNRWLAPFNLYLIYSIIFFVLIYAFLFNFILLVFGYFTDLSSFQKSGWSYFNQIIHGPSKWGWGSGTRDNFSYHRTTTVFWYKNDPLIAASLLFLHLFFFKFYLFLLLQVITILRVIIVSNSISFTLLTYFLNTFKEFYYLITSLGLLLFISMVYQFLRFPFELIYFNKIVFLVKLELDIFSDVLYYVISLQI